MVATEWKRSISSNILNSHLVSSLRKFLESNSFFVSFFFKVKKIFRGFSFKSPPGTFFFFIKTYVHIIFISHWGRHATVRIIHEKGFFGNVKEITTVREHQQELKQLKWIFFYSPSITLRLPWNLLCSKIRNTMSTTINYKVLSAEYNDDLKPSRRLN